VAIRRNMTKFSKIEQASILRIVQKGLEIQFDIYSWDNMIDDLELTKEEAYWAKKNISYKAYILGEDVHT
jgi:hypothetical protein